MDRGVQYFQENYADPSLAISSVATAFHLSGKYLSQLFKEQTGSKISAFIEQKRIDLACRLLRSTTLSVSEVGVASGYALTHTFRVAFKRSLGVTPLEWKRFMGREMRLRPASRRTNAARACRGASRRSGPWNTRLVRKENRL